MHSKYDVANIFKKHRNISKNGLSAQWQNTKNCFAFYNGEPAQAQDVVQFMATDGKKKRATVNFNKIQANVDVVSGFMAQNRRQARFVARVTADQGQELYSRNMNAIYEYHRENQRADQIESDMDVDMLVCGYAICDSDLSYIVGNATTDPNGEIIKTRIDPEIAYWDVNAREKNLLDARWAGYYKEFDLKEALELFDDSTEDDFSNDGDDAPTADIGYQYNPYGGRYDKIKQANAVEWSSEEQEIVRVYNHQWFEYETFYKAYNPIYTASDPVDAMFYKVKLNQIAADIKTDDNPDNITVRDMFDFDPVAEYLIFDDRTRRQLVEAFGDLIQPVGFKRKVFYTAVISGSHVFSCFKSISQQGFSIKFKTGSYNKTGGFWIGMVNPMMEPQKYYNKALTELMFTIAANSKGGVMVEENAIEDVADFETKYAKTDAVIVVKDGALSQGRIQEKKSPAIPTGLENIITLSELAISGAGVDPAMMGSVDKQEQSGILYKRRIRQVISKMAKYFDSIELYQKEDARLHADLIPVWVENNNGQFVRITGQDGADDFVQISMDMFAAEYDVTVHEAAQTPEDKQETAEMLSMLGDKLLTVNPQAAMEFYAEALNMIPIDGDMRNNLIKILKPDQEMIPAAAAQQQIEQLQGIIQQLQSEAAQLQMAKTQSEIEKNQADVQKTSADAVKTLEGARNQSLENSLIEGGLYNKVHVTI